MKRICITLTILCSASAVLGQASQPSDFAASLDLERFRLLAVQHQGRLKTLDTLAREVLQEIAGTAFLPASDAAGSKPAVQDPVYVYLDMMLRPEQYAGRRLFYVKKKPVRVALAQAASATAATDVLKASVADGRFSMAVLSSPAVRAKIEQLDRDVMRTSKDVEALQYAMSVARPTALKRIMRIIPPAGTQSVHDTWLDASSLDAMAAHGVAGITAQAAVDAGLDAESGPILAAAWQKLGDAWKTGDAGAANASLNRFAAELPLIAPAVYPAQAKLGLEHWYYKYHKMTWVWTFYLCAAVLLLMGIVYQWRRAKLAGIAFFTLAFSLHTVASGIRWYLAGRIPNSNMFEAVTAAAWFGAAVALVLEAGPILAQRRTAWWLGWLTGIGGLAVFLLAVPLQGVAYDDWQLWGTLPIAGLIVHAAGVLLLIGLAVSRRRGAGAGLTLLGASVAGMVAMMCGQFLSVELHSDIGTRMPVLNDLWLYIHTNMIIASYALIGVAYVTAAMYVVGRLVARPTAALWWSMLLPTLLIPLAVLIPGVSIHVLMPAWVPFLIVVVCTFLCIAWRTVSRRVLGTRSTTAWQAGPSVLAFAGAELMPAGSVAGGPALIVGDRHAATGHPHADDRTAQAPDFDNGLGKVLDGATMLLMELFFIMLWTGIIMGAIWADHSWGRPWGWDPKEVFALNTWIIFLILVHVRLKVREKALWTAVLVVIGTSVMLFNWIVVNFFITGLHSYA